MRVRWQLTAVNDLTNIHNYIAERNPEAARGVIARVLRAVRRLENFPRSGRRGRAPGTHEVVVPNLPYIVVYTHDDDVIDISAVFHAARGRD